MQLTLSLPKKISLKKSRIGYGVASLFSGCGGLDLGFTGGFSFRGTDFPKTKFDLSFSNDFDEDAASTYNANSKYFDRRCHFGDIRDFDESDIPQFDVLLAGFPCQPFSNAGKRRGVNDENGRGTLFYECERIIKGAIKNNPDNKPKIFVFENVRGILSSMTPGGRTVPDEIVIRMSKLGYRTNYKLIKASDYGRAIALK